jgi:hypothetical protein
MNWVLLIFLSTPGGDFIERKVEFVRTQAECQARAKQTARRTPMGIQQHPLCVTMDHWTGKNPMPGMPMHF